MKDGKPQGFWSITLANITEKRNRQMKDAVNKAARTVINYCLENEIGLIVFGWNKGQKDSANLGKKTNQQFVSVPTAKLKDRIKQLCEQYGI
jgi:IS605 OrfB family transposase